MATASRPPKPAPLEGPHGFLGDIHGNLVALDAALAALDEAGVRSVFALGDLLFGGDDPLGVWRRLRERQIRAVQGLSDRALSALDPARLVPRSEDEAGRIKRFVETRRALGDLILEQLRRLPTELRLPLVDGGELLAVHGSPRDPTEEMTMDMSDEELAALVDDDPADVVLCAASHVPFLRTVGDVHIANVGSVGAAPEGAVAHYTIVHARMDGARIDQHWVDYG